MVQLGIDIGGTFVKIGLINENWELVDNTKIPFPRTTAEDMAEKIRPAAEAMLAKNGLSFADVESVGAVVPGSINADETMVLDAYNLDFHDVPLKAIMEKVFPECPVYLANDADGAALAELAAGAFKGKESGVLLTLGTGLGGGIILNGKLFRGGMRQGTEPGHGYLVDGGEPCTCGNLGCMEAYVAATALKRDGARALPGHPESLLYREANGDPEQVTPKLVVDCAKAGDPVCVEIFHTFTEHLSSTIATFINIMGPEVIAIGGGLCGAGDFLFAPLSEAVDKKSFFRTHGEVVPAVMGNDAGMIGAAMLHRNAMK